MNIDIIREEIQQILEALDEQNELIRQHSGRIPQIEIDLFMSNIRDLYEACLNLNRYNAQQDYSGSGLKLPASETNVFVEKTKADIPPEPEETASTDLTVEDVPAVADLPITESIRFSPREEVAAKPKTPDLFSNQPGPFVPPSRNEEKRTLNEKMQAEYQNRSLGARMQQNQIRDLKSAIGINEKFQFINELFKGSMQDYALAITQLNQFEKFDEAIEYIDILKFKYNWDINSDAHHKLMDFVRRRYL